MSISRRNMLAASAGAAALTGLAACGQATRAPAKTFVLVHGAWHGGWCWRDVRKILEEAGHTVLTPTLSGLGETAARMSPDIGLETHIDDVARLFKDKDLSDIILVGHSYGGMIVTAIADRFGAQIKHVVYLDAAVPKDQQSMVTAGPELSAEALAATKAGLMALSQDGGVSMMPLPPEAFGVLPDHPSYSWVADNLTPHPMKSWLDPITLKNEAGVSGPRTYIHCVSPVLQPSNIPYFAAKAKASDMWTYHELQTGHDAMITMPRELSAIIEPL